MVLVPTVCSEAKIVIFVIASLICLILPTVHSFEAISIAFTRRDTGKETQYNVCPWCLHHPITVGDVEDAASKSSMRCYDCPVDSDKCKLAPVQVGFVVDILLICFLTDAFTYFPSLTIIHNRYIIYYCGQLCSARTASTLSRSSARSVPNPVRRCSSHVIRPAAGRSNAVVVGRHAPTASGSPMQYLRQALPRRDEGAAVRNPVVSVCGRSQ